MLSSMIFWTHPRMNIPDGVDSALMVLLALVIGAIIAWWFFGRGR